MLFRFDPFAKELLGREPFALLDELQRQLDASRRSPRVSSSPGLKGVSLDETEETYVVSVDLPGVTREAVELGLDGETLSLHYARALEAPEGKRAHLRERRPFERSRTFALPGPVDSEKVRATLTDGVLSVELRKAEARRSRQIEVQA